MAAWREPWWRQRASGTDGLAVLCHHAAVARLIMGRWPGQQADKASGSQDRGTAAPVESRWPLVFDLAFAETMAWVATRRPGAELTPEAHRFFHDRYCRLADWHRRHGHFEKAERLLEKAGAHGGAPGGDGPPYAAAMALPRPRRWVYTDAVGRSRVDGPDEAA